MRDSTHLRFDGRDVEVHELTVSEVDQLLADNDYVPTTLDRLLDADLITSAMLAQCSGLSVVDLEQYTPSELRPLIDAVKEVNPDFFAMARREIDRAEKMAEMLGGDYGKQSAH